MNDDTGFQPAYTVSGTDLVLRRPPCFDLAATLDCGQAFRFHPLPDGSWQGVVFGRVLRLSAQKNGDIVLHQVNEREFHRRLKRYFTLDLDYPRLLRRLEADPVLRRAVKAVPGLRLLRQELWETVCSFIISQNNNIPRIKGIIRRLCKAFGDPLEAGEYAFPPAARIAALEEQQLSCIRAGFRAKYILDAARKLAAGQIDQSFLQNASYEQARAALMEIRGVGPKVADCVLLFSCGRFEAFPMDVWMRRVTAALYPGGLPACFDGYGGIAQQYLFAYARAGGLDAECKGPGRGA